MNREREQQQIEDQKKRCEQMFPSQAEVDRQLAGFLAVARRAGEAMALRREEAVMRAILAED